MLQWWDDAPAMDTLRLSTREYCAVIARLCMNADQRASVINSRRHRRVHYRKKSVKVLFQREGATAVPYLVRPHNLSSSGIAFLHGFFVQTGTVCDTALWRADRQVTIISGKVMRCRFLGGRVHEIGVEFNQPIDLRVYVADHSAEPDATHKHEGLPKFDGRMLYLDDCVDDRDLVEFVARQLGVEVRAAATAAESVRRVEVEKFDLFAAKTHLLAEGGTPLGELLQNKGYTGPIVAVSPAGGANVEAVVMASGCDCVLGTPITAQRLADVFRGYLPAKTGAEEAVQLLLSSRWNELGLRPLILKYVERLQAQVAHLQQLWNRDDREGVSRVCRQLTGSSTNYGFESIAKSLTELQALVDRGAAVTEATARLAEIRRLCACARMASAATNP